MFPSIHGWMNRHSHPPETEISPIPHFRLFYPNNNDEPLFVTVLYKKTPQKSIINFWGDVQNKLEIASLN